MEIITTILAVIGFGYICKAVYDTLLEERIRKIRREEIKQQSAKYFI